MNTEATEAMKSEATADPQAAVTRGTLRVLKIATCPSLSGKSTLTYHIGYAVDSNRAVDGEANRAVDSGIQLRVSANTGSGFFSQEWVPMRTIRSALDEVPSGKTITSFQLHALFRGKSVNTPAFLFAVLKNEGLVEPAKDKQRQYDRIDPARFSAAVEALIAAGVDLKVDTPAKRAAKVDAKSGAKPSDGAAKKGGQKAKSEGKSEGNSARTEAKLKDAVPNVDVPRFINAAPAAPAGGTTPAIPAEGAAEIAATKSTAQSTAQPTAKTATKAMKKSTR